MNITNWQTIITNYLNSYINTTYTNFDYLYLKIIESTLYSFSFEKYID